jgi:hypothetical protein
MPRCRLLILVWIACLVSCAGPSTTFEQVWLGPHADLASVRTVVALYDSPDGAMRRTIEDRMARKLAQQGVPAVAAYSVLDSSDLADRNRATRALLSAGYDGVVVIRIVSTEMYPGEPAATSTEWGTSWPMTYEDYVFSSPVVRVETTLYSLDDGQLLWSARSKTIDPDSSDEVIEEVTSLVASALEKQGVATVATARR